MVDNSIIIELVFCSALKCVDKIKYKEVENNCKLEKEFLKIVLKPRNKDITTFIEKGRFSIISTN